ncbi:FHA domain-containing protein [Butyrivibrio sp. XB500-5]|uniref:FHA domain-containing protein n=1 Tax=Butyrivibrio sp. XB500-5 TaxID=2364880 RepID=UPI000EA971D7|nr:FHA domain-containing protein [Butyrivibrio sp. XB500-5]RKM57766.1 FHA domain-containing protein [Butyrivibrio sp. XB500-5]
MNKLLKLMPIALAFMIAIRPMGVWAAEETDAAASGSSEGQANIEISVGETENSYGMESGEESTEEQYAVSTVENAVDAGNGVVQINCVYRDDDGNSHIIKGSTGFIVGTVGDNAKQYLITSKQGIIADKDTRKAAIRSFGVSKADLKDKIDNISYEVVVTKDMSVDCSLYQQSDELDMAVFSLSENLANRKPLSIYTSDDGNTTNLPYATTDYVHSIGFPDAISYDANPAKYDKKDVIISSGKINNIHSMNDVYIITHDAAVGPNNCGGPLVNEKGDVIGMNVLKKDGQYSVAIDSTEIVDVLDAFGIEYNKLTPSTVKPVEEATNEPSVILVSTGPVTPPEPAKTPKWLIAVIIAVSVLLTATIAAVVFLLSGKKVVLTEEEKQKRAQQKAEKKAEKEAIKAKKNEIERPFPKTPSGNTNNNQSGGTGMETNMLSKEDESSTTLLSEGPVISKGQSGSINGGTLIRKKTGDNIVLCKAETTIGKDSLHVDYCIRDNSAISRVHAAFTVNSQGVCIEDRNSTNGTFVNGIRLGENESKMLNKGDIVRLANEEFEYRK